MPAIFPNAGAHQILSPHMAQLNVGHFPTESPVVSDKDNFTTNFAFFYFFTLSISQMEPLKLCIHIQHLITRKTHGLGVLSIDENS